MNRRLESPVGWLSVLGTDAAADESHVDIHRTEVVMAELFVLHLLCIRGATVGWPHAIRVAARWEAVKRLNQSIGANPARYGIPVDVLYFDDDEDDS